MRLWELALEQGVLLLLLGHREKLRGSRGDIAPHRRSKNRISRKEQEPLEQGQLFRSRRHRPQQETQAARIPPTQPSNTRRDPKAFQAPMMMSPRGAFLLATGILALSCCGAMASSSDEATACMLSMTEYAVRSRSASGVDLDLFCQGMPRDQ